MNRICQCKCLKEECAQCDVNVGYAIGRFFSDAKVIDASKVGTTTDGGKLMYVGKCEAENGGIADLLFQTETVSVDCSKFQPELRLQGKLQGEMSDYLEKWAQYNEGGAKTMNDLVQYEYGKMFVTPFKIGTAITPISGKVKDNFERKNKITSLTYKVDTDSKGKVRQVLLIGTNVEVDGKKRFTPTELLEKFAVSGCTTKNGSKYIKMTDGGIIRPVCLRYPKFNIMIDNVYVYMDDGHKTLPIGNWGAYTIQKSDSLDILLGHKDYKEVGNAIDVLKNVRRFIAPYWCMASNSFVIE